MNKKQIVKCAWCEKSIMRRPINPNTGKPIMNFFCDKKCKGNWQLHFNKPDGVTKEWLIDKYENDGLDCAEIARLVGRDTKSVWNWLRGFGVETRPRGSSMKKQWENGTRVHPGGFPLSEEAKEKIRQARIRDERKPYMMPDGSHYMKGRRGEAHHGWKGGLTPERVALYMTDEWKSVVKSVWHRADAKCERCGKDHRLVDNRKKDGFHIHHIKPFSCKETRTDVDNLALLCRPCHHFVHSKKNTEKEFL